MQGIIIKNTGSSYVVRTDKGDVPARVKGNFRIKNIRTTNPVAVGDEVTLGEPGPDGVCFITGVSDRRNCIIRRASNLSKATSIIAANIDRAMLVATLAHPTTAFAFIDRFLASAEAYNVEAVLVLNKIDLLTEAEDKEYLEAVRYLYNSIGYEVIEVSARTGEGLDALKAALRGRTTLLSGNSGVGKTTLINDLIPGLDLRTAEISEAHDQGMHTTTFSEMFALPEGGWIIDTPGVRGFGVVEFDRQEVDHYFPEIFKIARDCRYGDCTHTHEPGCAVRQAVEDSQISQSRYASYLSILDEVAQSGKYR
ncbi:MAG: ribosome small subunit-dependent GTPase A [Bacteroidales bacterium]|nr:ribosome small subunit-dependent GTPase A [Bacteroidales bacterium]